MCTSDRLKPELATDEKLAAAGPDPGRWTALAIVLAAAFMQTTDVTIVNVAIPDIQRDLHTTYAAIQLIQAGYQLGFAVLLITGGRMGDIYGRKRTFMAGLLGFVVASTGCGLAPGATFLVVARIVQGLFAAVMYPQVLSFIQVTFPDEERGTAFGLFGGAAGTANVVGPLIGGILLRFNVLGLSWRPIFLINDLVGAVVLTAAWRKLRESKSDTPTRLDVAGVIVGSTGMFLLVFPLVMGREAGWPWWSWAALAASLPVLLYFLYFEKRRTEKKNSPLVDFRLFAQRGFNIGLGIVFVVYFSLVAFSFILMIYLQIGVQYGALHAGLTTLPYAVGFIASSTASIRLLPKLGKHVLTLGQFEAALGVGALIVTIHLAQPNVTSWLLIPSLLIIGSGLGFTIAPMINIVLAASKGADAGSASGVLTTVQRVAGSIGVALIGIVLFVLIGRNAPAAAHLQAARLSNGVSVSSTADDGGQHTLEEFVHCFVKASTSHDPTAAPAGCQSVYSATKTKAAVRAADVVDYSESIEYTLLCQMTALLAGVMLVFFLPAPAKIDGRR